MRRAAKKDINHNGIASALADVGAEVFDISGAPGLLDILVAFRGRLVWLEVKQPKTRDDLTELERRTITRLERVGAPVAVVTSVDEALKAIGAVG